MHRLDWPPAWASVNKRVWNCVARMWKCVARMWKCIARKNRVCIALIDRLTEQVWTNVCENVLLECENVLLECENALLERSRYASPWLTAWLSKCKQRLPLVSDRIQDAMLTVMKTPCMTIEELHRFLTNLQDVGMSLQASTQTLVCKDLVRRWFSLVCRVSV